MSKNTKKTTKNAARRDGILSPEELAAAIEQYKARRAERMAAAADDEDTEAKGAEAAADEGEDDTVVATSGQEPETVEEQVQLVKDRRDRRDEAGDPETTEEAQGVIANQDEDIDTLLDIIDTLLAKEAFDEAEEESAEAESETAADEGEDEETGSEENADGDDEESACDGDDEESACDGDDEEGTNEDEGEEETAKGEDDEETSEGEDDEPTEETEKDEDDEEEAPAAETGTMNADSVDAIIRTRIQLGMMGRTLNLDGLENMSILKAKKKIIKAVRPGIRLDGRGKTFIDAAYALACDEVKKLSKKDTAFQKKQMFNKKATRADSRTARSGAESARERMIKRMNKEGK